MDVRRSRALARHYRRPRAHPYRGRGDAPGWIDLRAEPYRVETDLEDLVRYSSWPGVRALQHWLRDLHSEGGAFETNDCAFTGPEPNRREPPDEGRSALRARGRVMVLLRELGRNTVRRTDRLVDRFDRALAAADVGTHAERIAVLVAPARVHYLAPDIHGAQVVLEFRVWGDDDVQLSERLEVLVKAFREAFATVERGLDDLDR